MLAIDLVFFCIKPSFLVAPLYLRPSGNPANL